MTETLRADIRVETAPVRAAHRFDEAALADYLAANLDGFEGPLSVTQFKGGQSNPTFLLETPAKRYVLRKKPPGKLLPSAHAVEREYRIIEALSASDVPVAKALALCEDDALIGTPFYVMAHLEGRVLRRPELAGMEAAERAAIYDAMNDTLARLHNVDHAALGLGDFGKSGNYFERQIGRWSKQYRSSETQKVEAMERLIDWLPENIPSPHETTIVHGDYRLENMIFHPSEPRVLALLDWELSTLGHPLADLAYNCLPYHMFHPRSGGLVNVDFAASGIPTEQDYLARYCRRTGRERIENWDFYLAFSLFRLAAIGQGVYKRSLDGIASSEMAGKYEAIAAMFAELGWSMVEKRAG